MRITKMEILNFGPFYGKHEITFPKDGKGVHIIRGGNGQGKTSIQRAILWSLYGKILDRKGREIPPTSIINWTAKKEDLYEFAVVLRFNHEGEEWIITRKMQAQSNTDKKYRDGETLHVIKGSEPQPNPKNEIERLLPHDVSRFFFFDGEMLRDYEELLEPSASATILLKNSIEHVLGIPYLRIARDDLKEVGRKIESERSRQIKRLGGKEFDEMQEDFDMVSSHIDEREKQIGNLEKQMGILEGEITDLKRHATDIKVIAIRAKERLSLEGEIKSLESKKNDHNKDIGIILSDLHKSILSPIAKSIIMHLEEKHNEKMKKYEQKVEMVQHKKEIELTISAKKCKMCGATIDDKNMRRLESELKDSEIQIDRLTEIPEPNTEYVDHANRLKKILTLEESGRKRLKALEKEIDGIDHKISSMRQKLEKVVEEISASGIDEEEPRKLEFDINSKTKELGRLEGIKENEEKELREDLDLKSELNRKIASIDKKELKILGKRIETIGSVQNVLEKAVEQYRNERRLKVESQATKIFCELRTKESFTKLQINEQFGLSIITESGNVLNRAEWRSSGEEQLVALALIGALNKCAQVKAPVFMDTPFGRLDIRHGKRVLSYLPKMADQVVLLATDRELRKEDESILEDKIMTDRTVVHRGEKEGSLIMNTKSRS